MYKRKLNKMLFIINIMSLYLLPTEIWLLLIKYFDNNRLYNFSLTCKYFYSLCENTLLKSMFIHYKGKKYGSQFVWDMFMLKFNVTSIDQYIEKGYSKSLLMELNNINRDYGAVGCMGYVSGYNRYADFHNSIICKNKIYNFEEWIKIFKEDNRLLLLREHEIIVNKNIVSRPEKLKLYKNKNNDQKSFVRYQKRNLKIYKKY